MALTKELLKVLDDEEEPLSERLKIADNAFKSIELPIQHREAILLKWLGNAIETNESKVWELLLSWLKSQQMQDLNRNDIGRDDVKNLMNVINEHMTGLGAADMSTALNCVTALLENRNFHLVFKHDLEEYCDFISDVLKKIDNSDHLHKFITNEQIFNRNLVSNDEFYKYFITNNLTDLGHVAEKFCDNKIIFQEISKLVAKCLFHRNFKNFSAYLKLFFKENADSEEKPAVLPRLLLSNLRHFYNNDNFHPKYVYKLIFQSYCASYGNNFEMVYQFFLIMVETLGFDVATYYNLEKLKQFHNAASSLDRSLEILTELCRVLAENTNELTFKINDKTFSEFLQNATLNIMSLTAHPNESCYDFLNQVIILDPLIAEKILGELLVYMMLSNKDKVKAWYEKFLVALFQVFAKLHRIPNLLSKMTRNLKAALEGDFKPASSGLQFSGTCKGIRDASRNVIVMDMLPNAVLDYFTQCITCLASWEVINLFKTLFFHLDATISNDLPAANDAGAKVVYIEVLSTLMCQFLSSVRIAEHTVTSTVVDKFVKTMDELKQVLGRFGSALVNVEHNPALMRTYLNVCFAWGELYVTLAYYSINNEVVLKRALDNDSSACNITYLHPYLTRDQWCLISQRIANFGEKPCKQIMHKLYIQKLRAMLLFEESVGGDVLSAIRTSILSAVEDNWRDVIFDQLILDQVVAKSSSLTRIAELVLEDVIETNNFEQLRLFFDSKELIGAMLYTASCKLNKAFKRKQKRRQSGVRIPLCSKIFPYMTEELFLNRGGVQQLTDAFVKELVLEAQRSDTEVISSVNEKDLSDYMDVIKTIPAVQCGYSNAHEALVFFLLCVLLDLRSSTLQNKELIGKCERIIIGLAQNYAGSFRAIIEPFFSIIIDNFTRYLELFTFIAKTIFKNEDDLEHFRSGIDFLTQNIEQDRYLQCTVIVLHHIDKNKKSKSTQIRNLLVSYQEQICKNISRLIKEDSANTVNRTEAYALALKYYLKKDSDEGFAELLPFLDKYVEAIVSSKQNIKGAILLFATIIHNKARLKSFQENIALTAWNYCQNFQSNDDEYEDYSKLMILIFGHIPNEQFSTISADLLKLTAKAIRKDPELFKGQLKIWTAILACDFNSVKNEMWQKILESLLLETIIVYLKDNEAVGRESIYEDVVKFEISIMQNLHLLLTAPLIEAVLVTVSIITSNTAVNFASNFTLCVSLLETLLKYRQPVTMDYLPTYLQRYRALLVMLCARSNSDLNQDTSDVANCAHKLEKLTKALVACDKPMARISPYLIADILKQFEEIALYPNVKIHLNNCLYSLVTLCDQHAISFLLRILSTASRELFMVIHENYRKYYKFTGKV